MNGKSLILNDQVNWYVFKLKMGQKLPELSVFRGFKIIMNPTSEVL